MRIRRTEASLVEGFGGRDVFSGTGGDHRARRAAARNPKLYASWEVPISEEFWEHLRIHMERALKASGGPGVRLRGGPCDTWYVGDDAPMLLREDWYDLMPEDEKWRAKPGRYVLQDEMDQDARVARWIESP
jgi:hypothetical protein